MTGPTPAPSPPQPIEHLLMLELDMLQADMTDSNVVACLELARRLDTEDVEPQIAASLATRLNTRLLALQHSYWRGPTLPPLLHSVMHRRAAAIHARVPKRITMSANHPNRPPGISLADREQAYHEAFWGSEG